MKFVPFLPTLHKFYIIILIHRQASHTLNIRTMDGESGEDDENDEPLNHAAGVKCGKNEGDFVVSVIDSIWATLKISIDWLIDWSYILIFQRSQPL